MLLYRPNLEKDSGAIPSWFPPDDWPDCCDLLSFSNTLSNTGIFGTKNLSLLFGIVFLNHQFGSFLGAYLGGYFYDQFGSFDYAWYLAIVLSFIATALHLPIDERPIVAVDKTI